MGSSTHRTRTKIAGASTHGPSTRRARLEALVQGQGQVLEMITRRLPLPDILDAIARWVEAQSRDGVLVSLLLLDADRQHLLHGAAPSLPDAYNNAIHGLAVGPAAGSCGTAAYRRERVVVEDIATDPLWEDYRELALPHGLRACWSTPLIGRDGDVLGTFAMYYRQPRLPTADDFQLIGLVSRLAVLAVEHKQAEEERERLLVREQQALRQAEAERQRLHDLFMEAPAVIAVFRGPEHVFELANPLYMQSIGQGRDVLGKAIRAALPELAGQGYFELLDEVYARGESYEGHEVLVRLDRRGDGVLEDRYFDFTYQPSRNVVDEVDGVLVHAADVTEFVRARQQAEESEERFRTLADNISQFAWMADASGYIFWYNQRWYDYTGTTLDEMKGWGWRKVHHPDHVERVVEKISVCFESGEVWEDTFPLRGKDGEYRWFLSRAIPIRDSSGRVIRWFGTNTDITEQLEIERQKDDFISIASHELKTPVTSLKAYAQLLAQRFRREGDADAAGVLARMDIQLNKLTRLIGDLLDDAKIKGGKLELQPSSFDYSALVRESVEEVQRTAARHTIVCELEPSIILTADRERIGEVVTNLLTNAVKYSPDAERVVVRVAHEGGEIVTSVRDYGIGIPVEKREQVFGRFFRATEQGGHSYPGLGLGLYIAAEIVRRHGGRIWVESEEGRGSTFAFALPLDQPPSPTE
ncbi:MAG TPA: ATP-binding protein [Ktedonobacterales bacterium]|nr:ATP-binding protein [Ktedonobacterales bacterium]